jgi:uncharacterized protein YcbX
VVSVETGRQQMTVPEDPDVPKVTRITVFPIKSLDPLEREQARITDGGALEWDREYAILDRPADESYDPDTASALGNGAYINGKRTEAVHRLRSSFDPEAQTLTLRQQDGADSQTFDLNRRDELNGWLSDYFDQPVSLRRASAGGHPDHRRHGIGGPSVISTASLREIASWFNDLDTDDVRRRVRANIEIGGVPAFWEDRLYADHGEAVAFRIDDMELHGVEPCPRCIVPSRDPKYGDEHEAFRETFIRKRQETRPEWLDSDRFDHDFRLMVITSVPEREWGETIQIGDPIEIIGKHPY